MKYNEKNKQRDKTRSTKIFKLFSKKACIISPLGEL